MNLYNNLNNKFEYNKFLLKLYFARFRNNKTVFICSGLLTSLLILGQRIH
jgi:hypothetical protein